MSESKEHHKAHMAEYREQNKEKITRQRAEYRERNRDKIAERNAERRQANIARGTCPGHPNESTNGKTTCQRCHDASNEYQRQVRTLELVIVSQRWNDDVPRCRHDITPEISRIPCGGKLQIDHLNGGGRKEAMERIEGRGTSGRAIKVANGSRALDDLRVLCELHQAAYAIFRGDSTGGSDPADWIE